jgi:hypothetical protein
LHRRRPDPFGPAFFISSDPMSVRERILRYAHIKSGTYGGTRPCGAWRVNRAFTEQGKVISSAMIKALEQAVEKVKKLSTERQEYAAAMLEQIAEAGDEIYSLTDEERRLVREGLDQLDRGDVATDAEVRAVFDKYRT